MFKRIILLAFFCLSLGFTSGAQWVANTDESKVGPYTLPDPLTFSSGKKVRNKAAWEERRTEILDIFQREMYGQMPLKSDIYLETIDEGVTLAGFGIRKQVRMWFREDKTGPKIDWLIVVPRFARGPVPAIITLNYQGNHTILGDKEVLLTDAWLRNNPDYSVTDNHASEQSRGIFNNPDMRYSYPLGMILAKGYAFVTACYGEISPDPNKEEQDALAYTRVFELWGSRDSSKTDNTTSLAAWAWGLCRGLDMIENEPAIDASKVIVTGCSRLGKAALIAGAFDDRFAVVVPVQTGGGGVPIMKRNFGETIESEMYYSHWYTKNYFSYNGREDEMPFDQHMLLACVAPRGLLVEGFDEPWFDTHGEFLSLQAASPVWKFLGRKGLPDVEWPESYDTSAIGPSLGYVHRSEAHGISAYDWTWMIDFADGVFRQK